MSPFIISPLTSTYYNVHHGHHRDISCYIYLNLKQSSIIALCNHFCVGAVKFTCREYVDIRHVGDMSTSDMGKFMNSYRHDQLSEVRTGITLKKFSQGRRRTLLLISMFLHLHDLETHE